MAPLAAVAKVVRLAPYVAARDRKLLLEMLQLAQLAQALGRFDRKTFLASPHDQEVVAQRLARVATLARQVSAKTKRELAAVPWDALADAGEHAAGDAWRRDAAPLWTAVKKVVPKLVAAVAPLAAESELAAFTLAAPEKKPRAPRKTRRK